MLQHGTQQVCGWQHDATLPSSPLLLRRGEVTVFEAEAAALFSFFSIHLINSIPSSQQPALSPALCIRLRLLNCCTATSPPLGSFYVRTGLQRVEVSWHSVCRSLHSLLLGRWLHHDQPSSGCCLPLRRHTPYPPFIKAKQQRARRKYSAPRQTFSNCWILITGWLFCFLSFFRFLPEYTIEKTVGSILLLLRWVRTVVVAP